MLATAVTFTSAFLTSELHAECVVEGFMARWRWPVFRRGSSPLYVPNAHPLGNLIHA